MPAEALPPKIFVVGLPRTGTTSFCASTLQLGLKTAHTAFTNQCLAEAKVFADAPFFTNYARMAEQFPDALFVYLERDLNSWVPSIRQLLVRLSPNLLSDTGGAHPLLKQSYLSVFCHLTPSKINQDSYLIESYQSHKDALLRFFSQEKVKTQLIQLDISKAGELQKFAEIIGVKAQQTHFPHVNKNAKITYWKSISHPLKIESNLAGKKPNGKLDRQYSGL